MNHRPTKIIGLASAAILLVALPAAATVGPRGSISGTVVAAGTATPIANANVTLFSDSSGNFGAHATTGVDGTFSVSNVPQGLYEVSASSHGYSMVAPGYVVAHLDNDTLTGVTVALKSGLSISGTVRDGAGKPLGGAIVVAVDQPDLDFAANQSPMNHPDLPDPALLAAGYPNPFKTWGHAAGPGRAVSKANGTFTIDGLIPGSYVVVAKHPAGLASPEVKVTLYPQVPVKALQLRFRPGSIISGRLTHANGTPWRYAWVSLSGSRYTNRLAALDASSVAVTTNAQGAYAFRDLQPDRYSIQANSSGQFADDPKYVTVKKNVKKIVHNFHQSGLSKVTGAVTDNLGKPVPGVHVWIYSFNPSTGGSGYGHTLTGADGRYTIASLSPGDYYAYISGFQGEDGSADVQFSVGAKVSTFTADFTMRYSGRVSGIVTNADGSPAFGASVVLTPNLPDYAPGAYTRYASTKSDGSFELAGLAAGTFSTSVEALGQASPVGTTITVNPGERTTFDAHLQTIDHASRPGAISTIEPWVYSAVEGLDIQAWQPPANDGGTPIIGYKVVVQPGNETCTSYNSNGCHVGGLVGGVTYNVSINAVNSVGDGPVANFIGQALPTGPVTKLVGKPAGKGKVAISFVAPPTTGAITDYKIELTLGSGAAWKVYAHKPSTKVLYTLSGLKARTSYYVRVTPVMGAGEATTCKSVRVTTG